MRNSLLALTTLSLLTVGCSSYGPNVWYKPGSTDENQIRQDLAACKMNAVAAAPGVGGYNGGSFWASAAISGGAKDEFIENCMISKGYLKTREKKVPAGSAYFEP